MKKTNVALRGPELKSPWSTPRGRLEYELALCDRSLAELEGELENVECELEVLREALAANGQRYDGLKAQLSALEA